MKYMAYINNFLTTFRKVIQSKFSKMSADTFGWLATVALHCSTMPSFFALMAGLTDRPPNIDMVLMVWATLGLLFFKAVLLKDLLNIVTIGVGFMVQATAIALIFLK